uniref:Succinate dehydrogenase assembly factor 4, mitochondrial n=1 Tax=Angiostrongylus cantonensis TaxID=6313 RepID=A0A0K0D6T2_ANGCA
LSSCMFPTNYQSLAIRLFEPLFLLPLQKPYEDPYLKKHPGGVNPETGEVGGPAGPEPTRYGDWERKGRVSDF